MLAMAESGDVACDQVRALASDHLADVRAKIADLKRMEDTLSKVVAQCAGGVAPDCPIIEALYVDG